MAEDKKVEYVALLDGNVYVEGKKYSLQSCSQKELAKLFKLGVKEVATK